MCVCYIYTCVSVYEYMHLAIPKNFPASPEAFRQDWFPPQGWEGGWPRSARRQRAGALGHGGSAGCWQPGPELLLFACHCLQATASGKGRFWDRVPVAGTADCFYWWLGVLIVVLFLQQRVNSKLSSLLSPPPPPFFFFFPIPWKY